MGAAGEAVCALGAAEVVAALAFAMGGATGAAEDGKGLALAAAAAALSSTTRISWYSHGDIFSSISSEVVT